MLKRKVNSKLADWKQQKEKKCLVVKGARQVGKTFAIKEFGIENYDEVLEINFKETPSARDIFSADLNIDSILMSLRFRYPEKRIEPGRTLIFLDEIQECPEAITSLKFWTIDRRFDVIASGSMLGIDYNRASSYPVGYVEYMDMYGLDFEEFLWSQGITDDMIELLKSSFVNVSMVPEAVNRKMMHYFRIYTALGGMPEVIQTYVDTLDFREADKKQREILQGYLYDVAHYASPSDKIKAEKCFLSLGRQLLDKENHKFQYKEVEKNGKAQKFMSSIEWLERADIVRRCVNVSSITYDLADYQREDNYRIYTTDMSLLLAMRDFHLKQEIVENSISGHTKGGIYESAAADILIKKGYPIYFYKNETTKRELELLIQKNGSVIPIEVKGSNRKAVSLNVVMKNSPELDKAYKFIDGNMGTGENGIITAPMYMIMFI